MDVTAATEPAPGGRNDDGYVIGPDFAAVLDGCTAATDRDSGCAHDVPWLVARLSGHLSAELFRGSDRPLSTILSRAIALTCDDHRGSCDLSNPDSPSSTVTIVRQTGDTLDYLVLADSPLVVEYTGGGLEVITDTRPERLKGRPLDEVARRRYTPDGFWVAGIKPEAGPASRVGTITGVRRALLLSDGASRLTERYDHTWEDLLALADKAGPRVLIQQAHEADSRAETAAAQRGETVRGKPFDDATAVLCQIADTAAD
ncbi:MAG: protein phosphatase 2C domain-containing protein [Stackebrandtia sp.]